MALFWAVVVPLGLLTRADPALAANGSDPLYSWGSNDSGQLGGGSFGPTTSIVQVSLPAGVMPEAITASSSDGYAMGSDGHLYAWGGGGPALGNGTTNAAEDTNIPVMVSLPSGVTPKAVAAGGDGGYTIGSDGNLYAWGNNLQGELGDGSSIFRSESDVPVVVSLPAGVTPTAIAGGFVDGYAIGSDGKLYAWGDNGVGELGSGNTTSSGTPVVVSLPAGVTPTAIAAGVETGYAIGSDGRLYAWGFNAQGQVGDGTSTGSDCGASFPCTTTPVQVSLPAGVTPKAVAGGGANGYAIGSDGHLYAWGDNTSGELGVGTSTGPETCNSTACSTTPVEASLPAGVTPKAVAGGSSTGYAIGFDGHLYAWGDNTSGELGVGTTTGPEMCGPQSCSTVPIRVLLPAGSIAQALGPEPVSDSGYVISNAATTTQLASTPDPARVGQRVTYTASVGVVPPGTGSPTGTVSFSDNGVVISSCGTVTLSGGQASCTVTYTKTGSHVVVATYSGDANFAASTSPELGETVTSCFFGSFGCDLFGANLVDADLAGQTFVLTNLAQGDLAGADLKGTVLFLTTLDDANLIGADLSGVKVVFVDLRHVNFTNANLGGAIFFGANVSGATWSNTVCPDGTNSNADVGSCVGHL